MNISVRAGVIIFLFLMIISKAVMAETCSLSSTSSFKGGSIVSTPLNYAKISVSNDMPDGTVLYQQRYRPGFSSVTVNCDKAATWYYITTMTSTPQPLSGWSGTVIPSESTSWSSWAGKIYETGLPGIGLTYSMLSAHGAVPANIGGSCAASTSCTETNSMLSVYLTLVKTGPVSPGVINAANFPTMNMALGRKTSAVDLFTLSFSGSIDVSLPTCTTPDYTILLGKWTTSSFNGKGSTTPWVQSDIHLTNCEVFNGSQVTSWDNVSSDNGTISTGTFKNNAWSISFSPVSSLIDATNGIMSVDNSSSDAATGIGIQISAGDVATADTNIIDFGLPITGGLPSDGTGSIIIPLSARYIQTEDSVTAGTANGKLIYTISYL
ncbi:fimbrial protein [Enterobacter cloacae]|jgi:type 1 fimbria pilin|uniref:fimbrial protein n=1 Tax=Enterobacter cloacae TaxID=550 RepID=UPI001C951C53|nr:fimbrial protein [Enterobacter cloacae]MBY5116627.1 type 1 fimbrial protein [Enterobacter cloacae]HBL7051920.1 type 1 fimbrial protein [Enterobacter cloacae]